MEETIYSAEQINIGFNNGMSKELREKLLEKIIGNKNMTKEEALKLLEDVIKYGMWKN